MCRPARRAVLFATHSPGLARCLTGNINNSVNISRMNYTITYYNGGVQADVLALPATLLARDLCLADRMETHGPNLWEPHTRPMGGGLLELRLKGAHGIARVFYCTRVARRIVILHCFVKKTAKTPLRERRIAETRMKEIKHADTR